jgi:hypothetical protein
MDTTKEKPYVELNGTLNSVTPVKKNVYMTAATQVRKPSEVAPHTLVKQFNLLDSNLVLGFGLVGFDYYNFDKVRSFKSEDMAFNCRGNHGNVIVELVWEGDKEIIHEARKFARDILSIVNKGNGDDEAAYGNFGAWQNTPEMI